MISFIVAFDESKAIGLDGGLPWHISQDLKLFKKNTLHKNIVMGRKTYQGLPRKLVDRNIFVVTTDKNFKDDDVSVINDFEGFLKEHENDRTEYIICGGASIYNKAYPYCHKGYVSFVKGVHLADTYLQCFDRKDWKTAKKEEYQDFTYRLLRRK